MEDILETSNFGVTIKADIEEICEVISKCIHETLTEIYKYAGKLTKKNKDNHFKSFQKLLLDFKKWDKKTKIKFSKKIMRKLNDIEDLIRNSVLGIAKLRFLSLAGNKELKSHEVKKVLKAIELCRMQPLHDFLYDCCLSAIMCIYTHPYLFDNRKKLSTKTRQEKEDIALNKMENGIKRKIFDKQFITYTIQSAITYVKGLNKSSSKKKVSFEKEIQIKSKKPKQKSKKSEIPNKSKKIRKSQKEKIPIGKNKKIINIPDQELTDNDESTVADEIEPSGSEEEDYWSSMRKELPEYVDSENQENSENENNEEEKDRKNYLGEEEDQEDQEEEEDQEDEEDQEYK